MIPLEARLVMEAWTDPGPAPSYHKAIKEGVVRQWPLLAQRLDSLSGMILADDANGHITVKAGDLSGRHAGKHVSFRAQPGIRATGLLERIVARNTAVILVVSGPDGTGTESRFALDPETDVAVWFA